MSKNDPLIKGSVTTTSDGTGHYQLQLPPGLVDVTVQASGFETYATAITITADGTIRRDVALVQASATLIGTIFDTRSGDPIADARIYVSGAGAQQATRDGTFTVTQIPAGERTIEIQAEGYRPQTTSLNFTAHQTSVGNYYLDPKNWHPPPHPP